MVHYYGEIEINWTDGEWKRLQAIKSEREKVDAAMKNETALSVTMSEAFKQKIVAFAKSKGVNSSQLIREALFVLTQ